MRAGTQVQLIDHPSPNFGRRRHGAGPDMVVLHYTAMKGAEAALDRLCDPTAEVSAHYLIGSDGRVWALVPESERAWHAGRGRWGSVEDVNSHSIGIELDNDGTHPFSEPQMAALEALLGDIMVRWSIPPERVIGHSDMAPDRKQDPGSRFDWCRLARSGLSVWPSVRRSDCLEPLDWDAQKIIAVGQALRRFGYVMPDNDMAPLHVYQAFCTRFGCAGEENRAYAMAIALDLAQRFPVDHNRPST